MQRTRAAAALALIALAAALMWGSPRGAGASSGTPPCQPLQLAPTAGTNGGGMAIFVSVGLVNVGRAVGLGPCEIVSRPVTIHITNWSGKPLRIKGNGATRQIRHRVLRLGEEAQVGWIWRNWCATTATRTRYAFSWRAHRRFQLYQDGRPACGDPRRPSTLVVDPNVH